jgi:hypothetical protein
MEMKDDDFVCDECGDIFPGGKELYCDLCEIPGAMCSKDCVEEHGYEWHGPEEGDNALV